MTLGDLKVEVAVAIPSARKRRRAGACDGHVLSLVPRTRGVG